MEAERAKIRIPVPTDALEAVCRRYSIRELSLFGSVLRDDFTPESDVDVLVQLQPRRPLSLLQIGGLVMDLQDLFGHQVDLALEHTLKPYLRREIMDSKRVLYVSQD